MNNIDRQYKELLEHIIRFGVEKKDRTGTGTKSIFGWQIRHNMQEGFPLLTTKKMAWKTMLTELIWFLRGDTNIKFLVNRGCHIWDGDAYKNYLKIVEHEFMLNSAISGHPFYNLKNKEEFINKIKTDDRFAKEFGELGPIYGKQWRDWVYENKKNHYVSPGESTHNNKHIDQIQNLIHELKTNPDSRRLMVSAWNVGELDQVVLPPCHYGFQCWTREENGKRYLSLMWNQRSVDTFLGLPFNIASYGLLLEIIAKEVNMIPDELIGNLGDTHLYSNHIEQAKEQITRSPFKLPKLTIFDAQVDDIAQYELDDFKIEGYECHPTIKAPLSN